MTPEEEKELAELEELDKLEAEDAKSKPPSPDAAKAAELSPIVDPSVSIPAQVLSTQPATSHPKGDEAAQADWIVKGSKEGKQVVYEPPLAVAKKALLSDPQLVKALFPDEEIPPEFIQQMDSNSDIYKAYADHKWNDARWAAADSGTTAYRYSKAPWLQGKEAGLSPLETLATKAKAAVNPIIEGANAVILGIDDTAALGAGRALGEAVDPGSAELNKQRVEEHPGLHTLGQAGGLFTPTGVMGLLGKGGSAITHAAGALAEKAGGKAIAQGAAKLAGAGVSAVAGGAAANAGREGVEAASDVAKKGSTDKTLRGVADRSVGAGLDPMNLGFGVGGEAAGMLASGAAKGIAGLQRYGGNVERVEQLGGKIKFGHGPVGTPGAEAAIRAGKARDISPQDVIAERIAPKIAEAENAVASGNFEAAKVAKEDVKKAHSEFKQTYFNSPEGKQVLPPVATMETNLKHLRSKVTKGPGGELRPVGNAEGVATARAELSGDVAHVSTKPVPGAIELSPEEAEMFLSPALTQKLVPKPKAPPPAPPATDAREIDLGADTMDPEAAWRDSPGAKRAPSAPNPVPGPGLNPKLAALNKQGGNVTKPPVGEAPTASPKGGGTNPQGVNLIKVDEAPTVPPKGKAAKPAGKVDAIPTRDLKPTWHSEEINQGMKEQEAIANARPGLRKDAEVGRKLDKEFSSPPRSREEVAEALKKDLSPEEMAQAGGYSHGRFFEINDALRGQSKMTPELKKSIGDIDAVFKKAAERGHTYEGVTHRGLQLSPEEVKQLDATGSLTAQGFMSSSTDPKIAHHFAATGGSTAERQVPVLFEINQHSGVPLGKKQGEIISRPGTEFRVTGKRMDGDTHVFQVEEVGHKPIDPDKAAHLGAIIGGGIFAVGASAASGDGDSAGMAASAGGLALALKKRGITKVYAVPRRYDAQQHEVRIGQLQDLTKDPKAPGGREAKERYAAALRDRDQRTLDGQPGGWSARQHEVSQRLSKLEENITLAEAEAKRKATANRDAPGGTAQKRLVRYSQQKPGELPLKKEIEAAGKAAGVEGDLRDLRLIDPLQQLRGAQAPRRASPGSKTGIIGSVADAGALRLAYPALHSLGSEAHFSRGGLLGTKMLQLKKKKDEEAQK